MSATTVTAIKSADPAATTNGAARPPAMTSTQRSQLKRARDAAAAAALADAATVPSVASTVAPKVQRAIGAALIVTAVLLAGVGMTATVDYSLTTAAAAAADRYLLAALAAAADSLTLMLPSAVSRSGAPGAGGSPWPRCFCGSPPPASPRRPLPASSA
jgi:hypothetical protein